MAKRAFPKGTPTQYRIEQGMPIEAAVDGIYHSAAGAPPKANHKQASNERKIAGPGGGEIVFGTDRPSSQASGYGAKGWTGLASPGSGKIDLVCGRVASARGAKGVKAATLVDNSFFADAARIYMCETTNVDLNFGLVEGVVGNPKGQSAIALKADQCRIIGRAGIKIVTGAGNNIKGYPKGETTSKGARLLPAPGIELIAGNNTGSRKVRGPDFRVQVIQNLQPVALAYNVRDCFVELSAVLDDVMSIVQNLGFYTQRTMATMATVLSALSSLVPPAASAAGIHTDAAAAMMTRVVMPMHLARASKQTWEANYLQHFSYKFLGSRSVRAT